MKDWIPFILTGYRKVLRVSLFTVYERIFNDDLQPQDKLSMIKSACKVASWRDLRVRTDVLERLK